MRLFIISTVDHGAGGLVRKYKFRSNSVLCLTGDLQQMLPET